VFAGMREQGSEVLRYALGIVAKAGDACNGVSLRTLYSLFLLKTNDDELPGSTLVTQSSSVAPFSTLGSECSRWFLAMAMVLGSRQL
jgi:hypothetical protein